MYYRAEVRLTAADVGKRIVLRWRRPASGGRDEEADGLGVLEAVGLEYRTTAVSRDCSLWRRLLCGDLVFAGESAEDLFSPDPVLGEVDLRWPGVSLTRCELAKGAVRPGGVVVQDVFGQHLA